MKWYFRNDVKQAHQMWLSTPLTKVKTGLSGNLFKFIFQLGFFFPLMLLLPVPIHLEQEKMVTPQNCISHLQHFFLIVFLQKLTILSLFQQCIVKSIQAATYRARC